MDFLCHINIENQDSTDLSFHGKEVINNIIHHPDPQIIHSIGEIIYISLAIICGCIAICFLIYYIYVYQKNNMIQKHEKEKIVKEEQINKEKAQYDLANRILEKYWKFKESKKNSPDKPEGSSTATSPSSELLTENDKELFNEACKIIINFLGVESKKDNEV